VKISLSQVSKERAIGEGERVIHTAKNHNWFIRRKNLFTYSGPMSHPLSYFFFFEKRKSEDVVPRKKSLILGNMWGSDWGNGRVECNEVCRKNSGKNV
jgi:hypothetical protein